MIKKMKTERVRKRAGQLFWALAGAVLVQAAVLTAWAAQPGQAAGEDLWENWNGDMEFPGDGTEEAPYQIRTLSHLMGLSQAVVQGEDFEGKYLELTQDLDLGGLSRGPWGWRPVGWYSSKDQIGGPVETPFRGTFDGGGNTIRGLRMVQSDTALSQLGLFGVIDGGTVKNLRIQADEICGSDNAGILAGTVLGDAVIRNVTVSGNVFVESGGRSLSGSVWRERSGNAGGITGTADGNGGRVTIENCRADGIAVRSDQPSSGTGGIAGAVLDGDLADNEVKTWSGNSDRIQGRGYAGGIAGIMENTNIYNAYVEGTVGGSGSRAAGGIIGKYESGNLMVARFAGDIGRTNMGAAAREGTFIGTRGSRSFSYGTASGDNLSYLFTDSAAKAKRVMGSDVDEDNTFARGAHIGYWLGRQQTCVLVSGTTEFGDADRFFYEELEDGIRCIVTEKLRNEFTAAGMGEGFPFRLDHFAPDAMGQPVRGYLLSVPRIDTRNENGTYDTDVAVLTAMPEGNQSYYRAIDKNHPAAVAPGTAVAVATAPKNRGQDRYQMAASLSEPGGVKAPTYINGAGRRVPMSYAAGGTYTFSMPERDTEINAEYVKVTTTLSTEPGETRISVVQTRSGDRKNPSVVTEVRSAGGVLIARYIGGAPDTAVQVQPVMIHAEHNTAGETADRKVLWSVDDRDLLLLNAESGYTEKDAGILPNLSGSFIQTIIAREMKAQADGQYREAISPVVYEKPAVVTAVSNPDTSADHQPVYGNCKVTVTFQIIDRTTRRVEGLQLNQSHITLTVTRKLTGYRLSPRETVTCSGPVILEAGLQPERPFLRNVSWKDKSGGSSLLLTPQGNASSQCRVEVRYDAKGQNNPAWIQNVIYRDNQKRKENPYTRLEGSETRSETVTATSEDQTHGVISAECLVTLRFVTVDETVTSRRFGGGRSYGGSGGSGRSGGYGGASGSGGSGSSAKKRGGGPGEDSRIPAGSLKGTWNMDERGRWSFEANGRRRRNEWAYIYNPYAREDRGQRPADWFYFDGDGHMVTGWRWVAGSDGKTRCYYLNENSDGTKGAMYFSRTTPDGYQVDRDGAWTVDGAVQTK